MNHFSIVIWTGPRPKPVYEDEFVMFRQAEQEGGEFEAKFTWEVAGSTYTLAAEGRLASPSQPALDTVKLPVDEGAYVVGVSAMDYKGAMFLLFTISDNDAEWGRVCRITADMKISWCHDVAGIRLYGAFVGSRLYVGGMGIMGLLNPVNGKFVWQVSETDTMYSSICPRREEGDAIVFHLAGVLPNQATKVVTLDRKTGKMIRTEMSHLENPCQ